MVTKRALLECDNLPRVGDLEPIFLLDVVFIKKIRVLPNKTGRKQLLN
jgi:hypothetical protein